MPPQSPDYYALIGVPRDASAGDIRWAYERALNRASKDGLHRLMTELSQAYDTLSDERRRSTYDRHGLPAIRERSPGAAPLPPPWRIARASVASPARYDVVPVSRSTRRGWRIPTAAVFSLGIVVGLALALHLTGALASAESSAPTEHQVICTATPAGPAYATWTPVEQPPACRNGAVPRIGAAR